MTNGSTQRDYVAERTIDTLRHADHRLLLIWTALKLLCQYMWLKSKS